MILFLILIIFCPAPTAVQDLTITPDPFIDGIMVLWQPPDGCQITEYKFQLQLSGDLVTSGVTVDTSLVLSSLEPCSEYIFSVSAVDSTNLIGPDDSIRIQTEERGKCVALQSKMQYVHFRLLANYFLLHEKFLKIAAPSVNITQIKVLFPNLVWRVCRKFYDFGYFVFIWYETDKNKKS